MVGYHELNLPHHSTTKQHRDDWLNVDIMAIERISALRIPMLTLSVMEKPNHVPKK